MEGNTGDHSYQMVPIEGEGPDSTTSNERNVASSINDTLNPINSRLIHENTSPPSSPPPPPHQSSVFSFKSNYINFILIIISFLILNYQKNQINDLKNELISQQQKYNDYVTTNQLLTNNITTSISNLNAITLHHDKLLIRLTTNTSNADVLDKLKDTKLYVNQKLDDINKNITVKLIQNQKELTSTQVTIDQELRDTMDNINILVNDAKNNIKNVQKNVTLQLATMSTSVQSTINDLEFTVQDAQNTIKDEIKIVRENIDEYVAITNKQFAAENDFVKYQLAGTFTLIGCLISLWHLTGHLRHYNKPDVQRRIMAVLWMVPIYSITSWLSLVFPNFEFLFDPIRDIYEAYAVYTFLALLIAILGDDLIKNTNIKDKNAIFFKAVKKLEEQRQQEENEINEYNILYNEQNILIQNIKNENDPNIIIELKNKLINMKSKLLIRPKYHVIPPFPCGYNYNSKKSIAYSFLYQCRLMGLQFVLMKPLLAMLPFIINSIIKKDIDDIPYLIGDNNSVNWYCPKLYIIILQNISVTIAFYGLLSLYHGTEKELEWCNPWPKFLCIKGVVFMTFWQGISIQVMSSMGMVDERTATQIQNLLICIEMLIASLAHFYIFPYEEWEPGYRENQNYIKVRIRETLGLTDFGRDVYQLIRPPQEYNDGTISPHHSAQSNNSSLIDPINNINSSSQLYDSMETSSLSPTNITIRRSSNTSFEIDDNVLLYKRHIGYGAINNDDNHDNDNNNSIFTHVSSEVEISENKELIEENNQNSFVYDSV